jgi:hypothetical protein
VWSEEQPGSAVAAAAAPDPAHLSSSHAAPWAAHHPSSSGSNGRGSRSPPLHDQADQQDHQQQRRQDEDGWQLVNDQAAARKLQGQGLLAGAREPAPYCREREGFRNSEHQRSARLLALLLHC